MGIRRIALIERLYIKNHLSFNEVKLQFRPGLSVFTGISGAGKSVLMNAILTIFGLAESDASLIEADVIHEFDMEDFGIENEEVNNFRFLKDKSSRYFINSQLVSRRNLTTIASEHIKFLGSKNANELESGKIIELLDTLAAKNEPKHSVNLENFKVKFKEFLYIKKELEKIEEEELKIEELKEFALFEINKIEQISPKKGEYEELFEIKKKLSKKDKINEAWQKAEQIFSIEKYVIDALNISEIDAVFFEDMMNELRAAKDTLEMEGLDDLDIEQILDRIEVLSGLNKRYGSVDNAIVALEHKKQEFAKYERISFEKASLQKAFKAISVEIFELAGKISEQRNSVKNELEKTINGYLKDLYMSDIRIEISTSNLYESGADMAMVLMNDTEFKNLSSGEMNRLRLAFIATNVQVSNLGGGVIILDEIDSNLSGKEAMSIAEVLVKISNLYQIFAISHQPQLSSRAQNHFLIVKNGNISSVKELDEESKITELARMISGETITKEAIEFAKKLRNL